MAAGINDATLNVGIDAITAVAGYLSLHTATPNSSGSNESTAARVAAGWGASATGGDVTVTNKAFTGGAANGPVVAVGLWSASTGGTFRGYAVLTGDATFNAAGEYTLTSVAISTTAS